jgi:hypothetical protein
LRKSDLDADPDRLPPVQRDVCQRGAGDVSAATCGVGDIWPRWAKQPSLVLRDHDLIDHSHL